MELGSADGAVFPAAPQDPSLQSESSNECPVESSLKLENSTSCYGSLQGEVPAEHDATVLDAMEKPLVMPETHAQLSAEDVDASVLENPNENGAVTAGEPSGDTLQASAYEGPNSEGHESVEREGDQSVAREGLESSELGKLAETSDAGWKNGMDAEGDTARWISLGGHTSAANAAERVVSVSRRRTFFMVRMPRTADSQLRSKIKLAELQLEEASKNRDVIRAALQLRRASKIGLLDKLKVVRDKERACKDATQKKRLEIGPLQTALNKFKVAENMFREDEISSEEDLNDRIAYLQHRIQHESIPLKEEKQLIREIKQLESHRSQVCANVAVHAQLLESIGPKQGIQDHCSILYQELDMLRNEQFQARAECEPIEKDLQDLNVKIDEFVDQLENAKRSQHEALFACKELKRLLGEQNSEFYKSREDVRKAKELASIKKLDELEIVCHQQVEGMLTRWNNDASFRERYIKNNEHSTLRRLETLDGRSLGPDEEPPLLASDMDTTTDTLPRAHEPAPEVSTPENVEVKTMVSTGATNKAKLPAAKVVQGAPDSVAVSNAVSDSRKSKGKITENLKVSKSSSSIEATIKPTPDKVEDPAIKEAQAAELKEKRRQEEMAKAREAAERKKRQAERAQAKALLRAQKEAERRDKEREKKARKKAAVNTEDSEPAEVPSQEEREAELVLEEPFKDSSVDLKGSSSQRRKPLGKKSKAQRQSLISPLPRKMWTVPPIWVWVLLALIVIVLTLAFLTIF